MKSKYFIRGFGVGVLITAIIVAGFSMVKTTVQKQPSDGADKTVVASAQPTDPANDSTAAPVESEAAGTAAPTSKPAVSEKPGETAAPASTEKPNTDNGTSTAAPASGETPQTGGNGTETSNTDRGGATAASASGETSKAGNGGSTTATSQQPAAGSAQSGQSSEADKKVTLEIPRGADSYTVASRLEEAGVISSAREFDDYLVERGYSERLVQGSFEISVADSYDQIAKKITGRTK